MHIDYTQKLLTELIETNEEQLKNIPVNLSTYGKFNASGVHENEPEPVPNFFIPERGIHFYDSDFFISLEEKDLIDKYNEKYKDTLKTKLPSPKSCLSIAEMGVEDINLSVCALAELLNQLYDQTLSNVLVVADDYNWMFRPTAFQSFRYSSIKKLNGSIPPYHMSLLRLIMRFDGHKIRRGFKVMANSNRTIKNHFFHPDKINFNMSHAFKIDGMRNFTEFFNFCMLCQQSNLWKDSNVGISYSMQLLMETQGNFSEMIKLITYPALRLWRNANSKRVKKKKKSTFHMKSIYNTLD